MPALAEDAQELVETTLFPPGRSLLVRRRGALADAVLALNFAAERAVIEDPRGRWRVMLDSWAPEFAGPSPWALPPETEDRLALGPWHAALLVRYG
ncbi:MAG: DUF3459 domain-containing protein [Myxococcales bacterium]